MHQLGGGDTHHGHTMFLEPGVTPFISLWAIRHIMTYSVNLNREIRFRAIKVEHVGSNRMLATEDRFSGQTCSKAVP